MVVGYESLKVEFAYGNAPLDYPNTLDWTDVTSDVMSCTITRGRSTEQDMFPAGTCQLQLDNSHFAYDPDNNADIVPLLQVRVTVRDSGNVQRFLFFGYVNVRDGWKNDYTAMPLAVTTVSCSDFLSVLATSILPTVADARGLRWTNMLLWFGSALDRLGIVLADQFGTINSTTTGAPVPAHPGLHSGELLTALINDGVIPTPAGVSTTGWSIDAHTQEIVQGYLGAGQPALQWLQMLAATEGGALYILANGSPRFDARLSPITVSRQNSTQFTFDDGTNFVKLMRDQFQRDYASSYLYNDATVTPDNTVGSPQHYSDATAITKYTTQSVQQGGIFNSDADALGRAQWLVKHNKDPITNPVQLKVSPRTSLAALDICVKRELRDRGRIFFTPPGTGSAQQYGVFVERIQHQFDQAGGWICTLGFSSGDSFGYGESYAVYDSSHYDDGTVYAF